jgi:hypothetical protein
MEKYRNPRNPAHKDAVAEMERLYGMAYPQAAQ